MHYVKQKDFVAVMYDTASEPGSVQMTRPHNVAKRADIMDRESRSEHQWLGCDTMDELDRRLRFGWSDGADKLRTIATKEIKPASIRRRRERSDQGDELDMQAVWRGDISRAWTRTRRQTRTGARSVSLICNVSCSYAAKADDLFWRGASALKLAEELSLAGYSVAIYAATGSHGMDADYSLGAAQFLEIKAEDAPLDVSSLAAIVAMPGFKRTRMHTGSVEICDREGLDCNNGLGSPRSEYIAKAIPMLPIPQSAFIQPEVNSREEAEAWIDLVLGQIERPELAAA